MSDGERCTPDYAEMSGLHSALDNAHQAIEAEKAILRSRFSLVYFDENVWPVEKSREDEYLRSGHK